MPNIKSAKKRVKVIEAKTLQNKIVSSALKTSVKAAEYAIENNTDNKDAVVALALKKLDMAVTKGILTKNGAARKKSSLARRYNASKA